MTHREYKDKIYALLAKLKNNLPEQERLCIIAEIEEMLANLLY